MSQDPVTLLRVALADRYTLERELGRGGMATVYLAQDLKHDRPVALKVLKPELAAALGPDRFLREVRITARLNHPHILPLLESGRTGIGDEVAREAQPLTADHQPPAAGFLYYVMPYVEGESLRDRLIREKQLPLEDALQIAREVADALGYAHSRDVVHRDIKPENILLESGHAVVADFGIARAISAAGGDNLTETGLAIGTPAYMSPEQAAGSRDLDGRSDLYSLGCVLYEMLAGEAPFTGPTVESVVRQHLSAEAPSVTVMRPAVPVWVAMALSRTLAKTPADRFNPVALFAEALGSRGSAAATTPPPSPAAPVFVRRVRKRLAPLAIAAVVLLAGALAVGRWLRPRSPGSGHPRTAIAVLPFENLSAEGPHGYFAAGLHDELLTQLSKVAALTVISRTSVMGYQATAKPLKEIAAELGVGSVVEGSVQVVGDRLRVNVQLIDAETDAHLWAERYDRTLEDAFGIQSDVAQRIVAAVGAAVSGTEQRGLAEVPTTDAEAYRLYLQGREYLTRPGYAPRSYEIAQQLFERALALDPRFALAHAGLSEVHGALYWHRLDPSPTRAVRQMQEADAALRLAPDLPQAHVAKGLAHYYGGRDWRRALEEFAIALRGLPSDAALWQQIGWVRRRLGEWDEVVVAFERAAQLDPRDAVLFRNLGATYRSLHRYPEAVRAYDRALSLAPDFHEAAISKAWAYVRWQGQLDTLRAVLSGLPTDARPGDETGGHLVRLLLWERNADSLLQVLSVARAGVFSGYSFFVPDSLYAGWAHELRGDRPAARSAFEAARVLLDSVMRDLPDDWRVHAARGLTLAGLGRRDEARREASWLRQSVVYREDAYDGALVAEDRARILVQAGDAETALDEVERLLGEPSHLSVHVLRLDPLWDPIRTNPRFQALLVKYANPEPKRARNASP